MEERHSPTGVFLYSCSWSEQPQLLQNLRQTIQAPMPTPLSSHLLYVIPGGRGSHASSLKKRLELQTRNIFGCGLWHRGSNEQMSSFSEMSTHQSSWRQVLTHSHPWNWLVALRSLSLPSQHRAPPSTPPLLRFSERVRACHQASHASWLAPHGASAPCARPPLAVLPAVGAPCPGSRRSPSPRNERC